jgi:hypothetical protein
MKDSHHFLLSLSTLPLSPILFEFMREPEEAQHCVGPSLRRRRPSDPGNGTKAAFVNPAPFWPKEAFGVPPLARAVASRMQSSLGKRRSSKSLAAISENKALG